MASRWLSGDSGLASSRGRLVIGSRLTDGLSGSVIIGCRLAVIEVVGGHRAGRSAGHAGCAGVGVDVAAAGPENAADHVIDDGVTGSGGHATSDVGADSWAAAAAAPVAVAGHHDDGVARLERCRGRMVRWLWVVRRWASRVSVRAVAGRRRVVGVVRGWGIVRRRRVVRRGRVVRSRAVRWWRVVRRGRVVLRHRAVRRWRVVSRMALRADVARLWMVRSADRVRRIHVVSVASRGVAVAEAGHAYAGGCWWQTAWFAVSAARRVRRVVGRLLSVS